MRRLDKKMDDVEAWELLKKGEYGVLSMVDPQGRPYGIPLSYVVSENMILFHCALEGVKLDAIKANPRVSFCTVGATELLPHCFTTRYESVVVHGVAHILPDEEKIDALMRMVEKYSPGHLAQGRKYADADAHKTAVVRIEIEAITGKRGRG